MLRRLGIGLVNLIEVDVVGAKSFEARFRGGHYIAVRSALQVRTVAHRHAELGRDDNLAAAISERFAEQLFGGAAIAVDVGGVEQRDALVERLMHDGARLFRVASHAEVVASEADGRNLESRVAKIAKFHDRSFGCVVRLSLPEERRPASAPRHSRAGRRRAGSWDLRRRNAR